MPVPSRLSSDADEPPLPMCTPPPLHAYQVIKRASINKLLLLLGFPRASVYRGNHGRRGGPAHGYSSFWDREPDLETVLREAYWYYRKAAWACHPDRGGDAEAMAWLNAIWAQVLHLFARRGIQLNGARPLAPVAPLNRWQEGVNTKEAAQLLGLSRSCVQILVAQGTLPALWRTPTQLWIRLTDVHAYAARRICQRTGRNQLHAQDCPR